MVRHIRIVSLSSGILGEDFIRHELAIGLERLHARGVEISFGENALKGLDYIKDHPEARARDLCEAFSDPTVDMILCAIGGDDTYRLLPYLFDHDELKNAVTEKIFLGFSDTTVNHLMLHKVGLKTFYGQSFLSDVCEIDHTMLPYTEHYFDELLATGTVSVVRPSDVFYDDRETYGVSAVGTPRTSHKNGGYELLQGSPVFEGPILGGCIDTLYDLFDNTRYADSVAVTQKYGLFPSKEDWRGRILLLETSEERMSPETYEKALLCLKDTGVFDVVSGVLIGRPIDSIFTEAYKKTLVKVLDNDRLPVLCNVDIGHGTPRCILPFGVNARVDAVAQTITFGSAKSV